MATLDADALTVRLAAEAPIKARLAADGQSPDLHELTAGQVVEGRGVGAFSIMIEGVGRIDIGRGAGEPADLMEQLRLGRGALAARLSEWRAASVADLERRLRRAEQRRVLEERIAVQLGRQTLPDLESRLAELDGALRDLGFGTGDPVRLLPPGPDLHVLGGWTRPARSSPWPGPRARTARRMVGPRGWSASPTRPRSHTWPTPPAWPSRPRTSGSRRPRASWPGRRPTSRTPEACARRPNASSPRSPEGSTRTRSWRTCSPGSRTTDRASRRSTRHLRASRRAGRSRSSRSGSTPSAAGSSRSGARPWSIWTALNSDHRVVTRIRDDRAASRRQLREALRLDADPKVRCAALREREEQWRRAEAAAGLRRDALPPDPAADGETFEDRRRQVEDRCREGELRLAERRAELATMGADGLDSQVVLAQEQLDHRKARVDDLQRDASAWALLHHLLDEEETRQSHDVAARIQALATGTVIQLTGGNAQGVAFDPKTLAPVEAQVPCHGFRARLEQFSRGTREQIALACRLQIGILLSQE